MTQIALGVFSDRAEAESAIDELESNGMNPKHMSIVVKDKEIAEKMESNTGASVAEGAASGATTGGVLGGIAGFLIGIGALAIPGIGGLLIGGPLVSALGLSGTAATTASGAITGALAGGVVGALVGLGIPEEEAKEYEQDIEAGGVLLVVPEDTEGSSRGVLEGHGANKVRVMNVENYELI